MILISKLLLGSVAVATFAGSVMLPDAVDLAHELAVSLRWPGAAGDSKADKPGSGKTGETPQGPSQCGSSCNLWALFSQVR